MWAQSPAEIGQIVATARRYRNLTQAELARELGTTQAWVSEVEQGKQTAQIGKVLRTLSHLGVRLQTGIVPWNGPKPATDRSLPPVSRTVSLANILNRLGGSPTRPAKPPRARVKK